MNVNWDLWLKVVGTVVTAFIAIVGWQLPRLADRRRRQTFLQLLAKELAEMGPASSESLIEGSLWTDLLSTKNKRFIHRVIFSNPALSRDFILSLDPDLAYEITQMWSNFDLAADSALAVDKQFNLATSFRNYLGKVCERIEVAANMKQEDREKLKTIEPRWTAELEKQGIRLPPFKLGGL